MLFITQQQLRLGAYKVIHGLLLEEFDRYIYCKCDRATNVLRNKLKNVCMIHTTRYCYWP